MKNIFSFINKNIYKYVYLIVALIGTFWIISLFELLMTISNGIEVPGFTLSLGYKIFNDFWTGILIGLLLLPLYLFFSWIKESFGKLVFNIVFILIIFGQLALVTYSLTTLLNLGADLLGYSLNDIYLTISASTSGEISLISILPVVIFPAVFFSFYFVCKRYVSKRQIMAATFLSILLLGSLKLVLPETSNASYVNKTYFLTSDILRSLKEKNEMKAYNLSKNNNYPLLVPFDENSNVLGPFLNIQEEKPTIVILLVEGLGSEFVDGNSYSGFTPYIDSLITKSLYWENFVSTSGRTFSVLPSILGSLPYGENGFLEIKKIPSHMSLISILKANGYTTSYYEGGPSSFDRKINFLEYNGIDHIIDESKYELGYKKTESNSGGFSWGYPDSEMFRKLLSELDGKKLPRLDIALTLSNHEPFEFPGKEEYLIKVDSILNSNRQFGIPKNEISAHKEIYASLLYTDKSIKDFMQRYSKRPEYNNTLFIITGDHRLIPITQKDKLCRFHVPFLIYSPMLKKAEKFKSISSHWDVTPSIISLLIHNNKINNIDETAWISQGLDTVKEFRNIHQIPLMRYKGNINDFIYKDYLLSDGKLFKINEDFGTYKVIEENLIKIVSDSLKEFKKMNAYITQRNKIFPDSLNIYTNPSIEFSKEELAIIKELTYGLNFDQAFNVAREKAFNKEREKARLLCDYILNELPNHADARTLKGRTLAWDGKYKKAEVELLNVIKRSPYYGDSYLALLDLYWWSDQDEKSIQLFEKARKNKLKDPEIGFKVAKAYERMHNLENANKIIDSILKKYPDNENYQIFKQSLQ